MGYWLLAVGQVKGLDNWSFAFSPKKQSFLIHSFLSKIKAR